VPALRLTVEAVLEVPNYRSQSAGATEMIYITFALVAAFSGGVWFGWSAAMTAFVASVKRGTMQKLIDDYEDVFGKPCNPKD